MRSRLLCCTVAALVAGSGVALAAGLNVSSQRLSTQSGSAAVPTTTCTAPASADAWIDQAQPTTSLGTGTQLRVRSYDTTILLGSKQNARTLAHFDLSACAIPASAAVRSARLRLHLDQAPSESRTYAAKRATSAWSETTVTWDTAPGVELLATDDAATGTTSGATLEWDVTADAKGFVSGALPNHGWRIEDLLEDSATEHEARFASRENATATNHPKLVVTYWP